jgi:hypothetical protein
VPINYYQPSNDLLNAVDDHDFDELVIPYNDIYSQEYYFYAYSFLNKDRKAQYESKEGYTYIKQTNEHRMSTKALNFLYGDQAKDMTAWQKRIKANIFKYRENVHSEQDTDYIELDLVLQFLMEDYHKLRLKNQKKIRNALAKFCSEKEKL